MVITNYFIVTAVGCPHLANTEQRWVRVAGSHTLLFYCVRVIGSHTLLCYWVRVTGSYTLLF